MTESKVKNMYTDFVYPKYEETLDEKAPEFNESRYLNLKTKAHTLNYKW